MEDAAAALAEPDAVVVLGISSYGRSSCSSGRVVVVDAAFTVDDDNGGGAPLLLPAWTLRCEEGLPSVPMSTALRTLQAHPIVKCSSHHSPSYPFCDDGIDFDDASGCALLRRAEDSACGTPAVAAEAANSSRSALARCAFFFDVAANAGLGTGTCIFGNFKFPNTAAAAVFAIPEGDGFITVEGGDISRSS